MRLETRIIQRLVWITRQRIFKWACVFCGLWSPVSAFIIVVYIRYRLCSGFFGSANKIIVIVVEVVSGSWYRFVSGFYIQHY